MDTDNLKNLLLPVQPTLDDDITNDNYFSTGKEFDDLKL